MAKSKKTTKTVSWRTLNRRAAALEKKNRGKPTAASKRLRKAASDQRRKGRVKNAASIVLSAALDQATTQADWHVNRESDVAGNNTANNNVPLTYSHAEHHKAIFDAVEGAVHRANDNIVCSFIAMFRSGNHPGARTHTPWMVEAETVRALIEVLERAGYTATGRRHFEKSVESEKAS